MKKFLFITIIFAFCFIGITKGECAWVLWENHPNWTEGSFGGRVFHPWKIIDAYTTAKACKEAQMDYCNKYVDLQRPGPNQNYDSTKIYRVNQCPDYGGWEGMETAYFKCLPESFDPREKSSSVPHPVYVSYMVAQDDQAEEDSEEEDDLADLQQGEEGPDESYYDGPFDIDGLQLYYSGGGFFAYRDGHYYFHHRCPHERRETFHSHWKNKLPEHHQYKEPHRNYTTQPEHRKNPTYHPPQQRQKHYNSRTKRWE